MAIIGVNVEAISDYVIKRDRTSGDPTTWKLGTLSSRELGTLRDKGAAFVATPEDVENARAEFHGNQVAFSVVRLGLRGWENFQLADGSQVPFTKEKAYFAGLGEREAVPETLVGLIPVDDIQELAETIQKSNSMAEAADQGKPSGA